MLSRKGKNVHDRCIERKQSNEKKSKVKENKKKRKRKKK